MGSGIGTISIDFNSEIAKFVGNNEKVGKSLDSVAAKAKDHAGFADELFGKLVGADLVAGGIGKAAEVASELARNMVEVVAHTMEEVAAADKLAKSFDISASSLMSLQNAAKLAGHIDADAFNASFEHMAATIGEAAEKGGEAEAAFRRIGLDAKTLRDEGPDQAFRDIAHAIGNVGDASTKAAIAKQIFGKAGVADMPLFGDALDDAEAKAKRFGATMSEIDIQKVAAASEQFETLEMQFKGIGNQVTAALAPSLASAGAMLSGIISIFADVSSANQKTAEAIAHDNAAKRIADDCVKADAEISKLAKELGRDIATNGLSDADKKIYDLRQQFKELTPELWQEVHALQAMGQKLDDLKKYDDDAKKLNDAFAETNARLETIGMSDADKKAAEIGAKFRGVPDELKESVFQLQKLQAEAGRMEAWGKIEAELGKMRQEIVAGGDETSKWLARFKDEGATGHQLAELKELHDQQKAINETAEKSKSDLEEIKRLAEEGETPFQKWTEELEKANRLLSEGKISQEEFGRAKKKIDADLQKENSKGGQDNIAATARRFDFQLPGNRTSDPAMAERKKQTEYLSMIVAKETDSNKYAKKLADSIAVIGTFK